MNADKNGAMAGRSVSLAFSTAMFATIAFLVCLADWADGVSFIKDIDDQMRELQIRALYFGQNSWFDLTLPFVQMPEPYVSPWSRIVDLPYIAIAHAFAPLSGDMGALRIAYTVWPVMLLLVFSAFAVAILERLMRSVSLSRIQQVSLICGLPVIMAVAIYEFEATRIDHHNVQLVTLAAMIYGLVRWDLSGAIMVGIASAISLLIGLECLPFVVVCYAGIAAAYLFMLNGSRAFLLASAGSIAIATVAGGLVFAGPDAMMTTACDAFSAVYLYLGAGAGMVLIVATLWADRISSIWGKSAAFVLPGLVLLTGAVMLFPECLHGPYNMIDPVSRSLWFERIPQEQSILYFMGKHQYGVVFSVCLWTILSFASLPFLLRNRKQQPGTVVAFAVSVSALVLTLLLTRYIRFAAALMPLFLPYLVARLGDALGRAAILRTSAAIMAVAVSTAAVYPSVEERFDAADLLTLADCKKGDYSILQSVSPGRTIMPQGMTLTFLLHAPKDFSVPDIQFHRASAGMTRAFQAFLTHDSQVRKQMLLPFDYVAACKIPDGLVPADNTMFDALSHGRGWPGLELLTEPGSLFQLYRINHASLG